MTEGALTPTESLRGHIAIEIDAMYRYALSKGFTSR